jgi:capsular polysaccharide biosynthesis protein
MAFQILRRCSTMWGKASLKAADPDVSYHSGAVYLPYSNDRSWGIYDATGKLIPDAVDYHGPSGQIENQKPDIDLVDFGRVQEAPEEIYIYGGFLNPHYGHFIVNSLSRQWVHLENQMPRAKILWHGPADAKTWFKIPFIKAIFEAIGLPENRFATFDKPTLIPRLLVPHASFNEQHYVHAAFGRLCRRIGGNVLQRSVINERSLRFDSRPTYLSKAALASGVGRISNEQVIVDILERAGVDIVFPEKLTLADQVRIFAERDNICGMAGSAMHTHAFWPSAGSVSVLNATDGPNSNFFLIDLAASLTVNYVFAPGAKVIEEAEKRFLTSIEMADPEHIAADLLVLFEEQAKRGRRLMI